MSSGKHAEYEEVAAFLGDYGLFQILVMVLLSVSALPSGYMGPIAVFIADAPDHHCRPATGAASDGEHQAQPGSRVGPDSCSRYINSTGEGATEPCVDGWVFSTETYTSTAVSEWELVCDDSWKAPFSTSLFFLGILFGSFISSHLSDRFGRKPVFFASMAFQTLMVLIQAASVSWTMFCVCNFLRGVAYNYITIVVLGSEILRQNARVTFTLVGSSLGFGVGYALLPLLAYFVRGWRMMLVAAAVPGFLAVPMWWVIPESPRWLIQKGRLKEAELVIRKAAAINKVPVPDELLKAEEDEKLMAGDEAEESRYTWMDLFRTSRMRNVMLLTITQWTTVSLVFVGMSLNTSNLNGNIYLNCFMSAASELVGYVASWLVVDRLSRPILVSSSMFFCSVMFVVIRLIPEDMHVLFQTLTFVGKLSVSSAYSVSQMWATELTPTVVRNRAVGLASSFARFGSVVSPYVIYIGVYSKMLPYIVFSTISLTAAAASFLLPDTRNCKLPDLIHEAPPIRQYRCFSTTKPPDRPKTTVDCK